MLRLRHSEVQDWPTAPGTITRSTQGNPALGDKTKAKSYLSLLRYTYTVSGRQYRGRFVTLARAADKNFARRHPVGTAVRVRYDPRRPAISYLDTRFHAVWQLRLYLGLGLMLLSVTLWALYRQQQLRRRLRVRSGELLTRPSTSRPPPAPSGFERSGLPVPRRGPLGRRQPPR